MPSEPPPVDEIWYVTQSKKSIRPRIKKDSVTPIPAETYWQHEIDVTAKSNIRPLPPTDGKFLPYTLTMVWKMWRPLFARWRIMSRGNWSWVYLPMAVASLLDTGTRTNLMNKDFLPKTWKESIKSIKSRHFRVVSRQAMDIEVIVPLFFCYGNRHVHAWFRIVRNLPVHLWHWTSFIDR